MKTVNEFMQKLDGYFGGLKNRMIAEMIAEDLRYIKPNDLDILFRQLTISLPANWSPDLKSITEAIKACKIDLMVDGAVERKCPVCFTINYSTGICPVCCYRPEKDGTPEEHRKWWQDWKEGKEPHFDVGSILKGLSDKSRVKD